MIVMNSLSYNSQEHPSTLQFYRRLRQDYHALTRYLAQKRVRELEAEARQAVLQQLRGVGRVSFAVDGWTVLFKGDPLADFASILVSLPCSQAGVERVFSAADFATENRERLGFDHLADEVFVRYNTNKLAAF